MNGDRQINYSLLYEFADEFVDVTEVSSLEIFQAIVEAIPVDSTILFDRVMHVLPATRKRLFSNLLQDREGHLGFGIEVSSLDQPSVLPQLENDEDCP